MGIDALDITHIYMFHAYSKMSGLEKGVSFNVFAVCSLQTRISEDPGIILAFLISTNIPRDFVYFATSRRWNARTAWNQVNSATLWYRHKCTYTHTTGLLICSEDINTVFMWVATFTRKAVLLNKVMLHNWELPALWANIATHLKYLSTGSTGFLYITLWSNYRGTTSSRKVLQVPPDD